MWRITVADDGIGIDPRHRDRVFKMFQRLHDREAFEGTGIGLAICRKIVERQGGEIWVDAREGGGSVFSFTLPAVPAPRRGGPRRRRARPRRYDRGVSNLRPMADVSMPRLSDSMEEGTILKWLKSDGDEVKRGDELVEIETDKANMTYEADQDGVLSISASEGDTLAVGEKIASIGEGGGGGEEQHEAEQPEAEAEAEQQDEQHAPRRRHEDRSTSRGAAPEPRRRGARAGARAAEEPAEDERRRRTGAIRASPVARRMARELGLELEALEGTGPGGRIVKADVEAAAGGRAGAGDRHGRGARAGAPRPRRSRPRSSRRRARPPATARPAAATRDPGAHPPAADRRPPDGRVEGHRAGLRPQRRGRHGGGGRAAQAAQGRRRRRARRPPSTTSSSRRARSR